MGANESAEANGVTCNGCGVWCPPANRYFDFVTAGEHSPKGRTFCFWTVNQHDTTTTGTVSFSVDLAGPGTTTSKSVSVQGGSKLYKYFRNEYGPHLCSVCFVKDDVLRAKGVFLELAGTGQVLSTDFKLVEIGGRV